MKQNYFWGYCICIFLSATLGPSEVSIAQNTSPFQPVESNFTYTLPNSAQKFVLQTGANLPQFSMVDINNDGKQDLYVYDKHAQKSLVYLFVAPDSFVHRPSYEAIFPPLSDWALFVDYNKDGKPDLWTRNDENNRVILYKNTTQVSDNYIHFELVSEALSYYNFNAIIDTSYLFCDKNNIPAIVDFDNDGDVDFLTLQSTGFGVVLFLNNCVENNKSLEELSFEGPDDCWGDFSESANSNDIFLNRYPFCRRSFYRYKKHSGGSALLLFDKDGDGDNDLLLGNAGYKDLLYLENGRKDHGLKRDSFINATKDFPADYPAKVTVYAASFLVKLNNNKDEYLIVNCAEGDDNSYNIEQSGKILMYKNTSSTANYQFEIDSTHFINNAFKNQGAYSYPAYGDVDNDGINDFLIASNGNSAETKGLADRIAFYKGKSNTTWDFELSNLDFLNLSSDSLLYMSLALADLDGDNKPELLIGNAQNEIRCYKNNSDSGKIAFNSATYCDNLNFKNTFSTPHPIDVDNDGLIDLLIGSKEGPIAFYKNNGSKNSPTFVLTNDTFGRINNNPIVRQLVYDAAIAEWKDTFMHDYDGYTSITSFKNDQNINVLALSNKTGLVRFYEPKNSNNITGEYVENTAYFKNNIGEAQNFNVGKRASICYVKPKNAKQDFLVMGSIAGGISFFNRNETSSVATLLSKEIVQAYPNPANKQVHLLSRMGITKVAIYTISGQLIDTQYNSIVDISAYSSGIYILKITLENATIATTKIIKSDL